MLVEEAIRGRASIKVFSDQPVDAAVIWHCLETAVWAPNHHLTEPWRFTVVVGDRRDWLAGVVQSALTENTTGLDLAAAHAKAQKERRSLLSAPAWITIYSVVGRDPRQTRENFAASAAAAQNILLMAHDQGLGSIWRTSPFYDLAKVREALHVAQDAIFVGAISLGYPAQRAVKRRRTSARGKTHWIPRLDNNP